MQTLQSIDRASVEAAAGRPPLRIGIVGLGRSALNDHLPALKTIPGLYRLVAVCDLLKERRDIVEREFPDVRLYRQIEDMLDDPDIDVIDICLPSVDHVACALATIRRGLWTVVETPFATTIEETSMLKAASVKARGRLIAYTPGLFATDFRIALQASEDKRLGDVYDILVRRQDYIRRYDWQSIKRCHGGCIWTEGQDAMLQTLSLMHSQPAQLWSDLKRVASLGDAEDYAHIIVKGRNDVTADIELNGAHLAPRMPAFTIRGTRGTFTVEPGAATGTLKVVDPAFNFPRRRSSVRTPTLEDVHEDLPMVEIPLSLPEGAVTGGAAFWCALYATVRTAAPFPVQLDEVAETIRYLQLIKQASPAFAPVK